MALLAVGTQAQIGRLCSVPIAWEGKTSSYNYVRGTHDIGLVAYDSANRRVFEREVIASGTPGMKFYERIYFFDEKVMYTITQNGNRECIKQTIPSSEQWRPFGPPTNATLAQEINIGVVGEGFTANQFVLTPQRNRNGYYYLGTYTYKDCAPVMEMIERTPGDVSHSMTTQFSDITLGIGDPNMFIPPANCHTNESNPFVRAKVMRRFD